VQSLTPSGVTPATFFLTLFGYGLCNGLTTGSVTVDAPNSGDDGFTIPVASLTNGSTAVGCSTDTLAPAPASLTLTSPDGINYPAQTLTITSPANPIGAPFTYSVTGNVPLSVSVNGVSVPPGESLTTPATLSITANPAGLIPGTYTAAVSLKSNAMVQLVPVTLVIGQPPRTLTATPASLGFTAAPGASAGTQTVTLSTISQQPITILGVSSDSLDFLRAAITGGGNSVTVNNPVILTVAASVPLYAPVNAHITITSTAGLLTIPVAVSPQATSSPIIAAPGSIALGLSERANPMPVVDPVTLTTTSTSPVLLARITSDASWLSATASSQTISATAPATLMVTINPAHLASDSYVGHITLTPGSGDATVIPVSINVTPADANVFASPTSLRFTYPSYTLPSLVLFDSASPALMVTNLTIASRGDWLRVSGLRGGSYTGVNFGQHDVTFDPAVAAGLAAGTYSGTITVADPFNTNDLAIIHTILTVNPVKVLSQGKAASQSSIYPGSPPAGAAVDGNTSGNYFDGSVTSTNSEASPWWQVDLGASAPITAINIWNRNDCCGSRLQDFWVFVSDTPFQPGDTVASLQNRSGTYANHQTSPPSPLAVIGAQTQGRYVRVQLNTTQILSLAEVQVLGSDAPLLSNVAAGKIATQSSTLPGTPTANAAVDGHTDGNFFDGSVTATNLESTPWWQVDLGASTAITSMVIWNRTDCCGSRLSDYWVFISDTPFQSTDTPALLASRRGTFGIHQTAAPGPITTIPASTQGRYVRVQLSGTDYLSLAEVEVFGSATGAGPAKVASQSTTYPGAPGASAATDGNTDGNFFDGSVTATNQESSPWWQVDLGAATMVGTVTIWNRTDCCGSRLSDYWVFASNTPFAPTDTPATLQGRAGTFGSHQTGAPSPSMSIPVNFQARYVRVQLSGTDYLSLAEVQIQ